MGAFLDWLLLAIQAVFAIAGIAIFVEFRHGKDLRNLFGAIGYFGSAVASYWLDAWWPLPVGFALMWFAKQFGADPTDDHIQRP